MLSHAYVFYGPDETVKKEIAYWFANKILNNRQAWHPDLLTIKPEASANIVIDLARQIKKFLVLSPYVATYKIVIIESAEKLNDYAQNALLKIFEEAPKHAIIILCAAATDSLLETIVSRGVKLPFWRGQQTDFKEADKQIVEILRKFSAADINEKYLLAEKLGKNNPVQVFELWLKFLRNQFLAESSNKTALILKISQEIYFKLNETNFNHKLAYDELILNLEYGNFGKI